jgi:hypothetical protein
VGIVIVSSLLNKEGEIIGEARFVEESTGLSLESIRIVGQDAMAALGLNFVVTDHTKSDVTVFVADEETPKEDEAFAEFRRRMGPVLTVLRSLSGRK